MMYASFHAANSPDPATLGLVPLRLITEEQGGTWAQTRAKMLSEATSGCCLNTESGKGGITSIRQYAGSIARLIGDLNRKGITDVSAYGIRETRRWPADPDKPIDNFDDDVAVAKVLGPNTTRCEVDAYWAIDLPIVPQMATPLLRAYRQSIIHHRQLNRIIYPGKPNRYWIMPVKDGTWEPLPQGTLEGVMWLMKELVGAGDSVVLFVGGGTWGSVEDNFVATARRIIG